MTYRPAQGFALWALQLAADFAGFLACCCETCEERCRMARRRIITRKLWNNKQ